MIELGDKVRCAQSGFEGIVDGIGTYLNGCRRLSIQPTVDKKGKWRDGYWLDETTIEIVEAGAVKVKKLGKLEADLGDWVECGVTGFKGYVSAYTEYSSGNRLFSVQPKVDNKGRHVDPQSVRGKDINVTEKKVFESKQQRRGGPPVRKSSGLPPQ